MLLRRIALQEATERRLRDIFDLNPDAMGISRLEDGHYIDVNQGFTELTGYARDEVVGRTTGEIKLWADPYDREKVVAQLREGGQIRNREIRMCHKDGSVRTTLASARVVMLNGEPHIIFNTRDVSEFREVENELSKLSQAVTQSPAAIVITDRDGRIEYSIRSSSRSRDMPPTRPSARIPASSSPVLTRPRPTRSYGKRWPSGGSGAERY
jgi:PAS domain S-box-containing protein